VKPRECPNFLAPDEIIQQECYVGNNSTNYFSLEIISKEKNVLQWEHWIGGRSKSTMFTTA